VTVPLIEKGDSNAPAINVNLTPAKANLGGIRVIVVDDDPAARQLMRHALEAFGAEVRDCATTREVDELLTQWHPDVLVTDLAMPDEDGYSLIRRIRASGNIMPAVAVTAYVRSDDEQRVRNAGFQRHVSKPFDPHELVSEVLRLARP